MSKKKYFGTMIDCSRNAVMTVDMVKKYIDVLSKMGYNMLMLYTEDTYEIENRPMFGYLRGRYTKDELKEIVAYGETKGIELIPCIQTLAHLDTIFRWSEHTPMRDNAGILLVDDDKTYEFIDDMLKTVKECFKSKKIHIGMDEAHSLGLGKFLDKFGFQDRFSILSRHLKRVNEMVKAHGLEPLMWSDMFFRLANHDEYYAYDNPDIITEEITKLVDENIDLVYWDYFVIHKYFADNMIKAHKKFKNNIWFAGGALTWTGFTPHNAHAQRFMKNAIESCKENGVENIIITCWGDDGAETSMFAVLPTLYYCAELYRGNNDINSIKKGFKEMFGYEFDDFMKLDYPSVLLTDKSYYHSPDRIFFYNDPFLGIYDDLLDERAETWENNYHNFKAELDKLKNDGEYAYLFDTASALCDCMTVKMLLGKRTRAAYRAGDKETLKNLLGDYDKSIELINVFYDKCRYQWYKENKYIGFEIQDIRLGGLVRRIANCKQMLIDYIDGNIEKIEELENEVLSHNSKTEGYKDFVWGKIVSVNKITNYHH